MRNGLRIVLPGIGLCCLIAVMSGCSKRVPLEDGVFQAQQKVLVTFDDGRTLEGRIAPGNTVTFTENRSVYRARVSTVTESAIELEEVNLVDEADSYELVRARLADARRWIVPAEGHITLSRENIESVDLLTFDPARFARVATFWGYGAAVAILLNGERS